MKNFKWGIESFNNSPVYVFLFISRNKDNKDIEGFKERRKSFIAPLSRRNEIYKDFEDFVNHGINGEFCRMYRSVNSRDTEKIHRQLLHFLFDNPDFNLCDIQPKLAGIAAQKECAKTKHWMFDFDCDDEDEEFEFECDIHEITGHMKIDALETPHGFCIITDHGFDTRKLMGKWGDIATLKRDDFACVYWATKGVE